MRAQSITAGEGVERLVRDAEGCARADPFPHMVLDDAFPTALVNGMRQDFPSQELEQAEVVMSGRQRLHIGEAGYDALKDRSPPWRRFLNWVESPDFVRFTLGNLWPDLPPDVPCSFDPDRIYRVDNRRFYKRRGRIRHSVHWRFPHGLRPDPQDVSVHVGLTHAGNGYWREAHTDNDDRIAGGLLYLSDRDEIGGRGGDLCLHGLPPDAGADPRAHTRFPDNAPVVDMIEPKTNRLVLFLNPNYAYHSVTRMEGARDKRRFIYFGITARAPNIWQRRSTSG